jgi:hypothetical protein
MEESENPETIPGEKSLAAVIASCEALLDKAGGVIIDGGRLRDLVNRNALPVDRLAKGSHDRQIARVACGKPTGHHKRGF